LSKRTKIALVAAGVCVVAFAVLAPRKQQRLVYSGKTVQTWAMEARSGDTNAVAALQTIGSQAVPDLVKLLQSKESAAQKQFRILMDHVPTRVQKIVGPRKQPTVWASLRETGAVGLGMLGPDAANATPDLVTALADNEGTIRWSAATALARIGKKALPGLTHALYDKNPEVRHASAYALGQIGSTAEPAIPALMAATHDPNPQVRDSSTFSLWQIGVPAFLAVANQVEQGDDQKSSEAKAMFARFGEFAALGETPILTLCRIAADVSPTNTNRLGAIHALGILPAAEPAVRKTLMTALDSPELRVRLATAHALGSLGVRGRPALAKLSELAQSSDPEERQAAEEALRKIESSHPAQDRKRD